MSRLRSCFCAPRTFLWFFRVSTPFSLPGLLLILPASFSRPHPCKQVGRFFRLSKFPSVGVLRGQKNGGLLAACIVLGFSSLFMQHLSSQVASLKVAPDPCESCGPIFGCDNRATARALSTPHMQHDRVAGFRVCPESCHDMAPFKLEQPLVTCRTTKCFL